MEPESFIISSNQKSQMSKNKKINIMGIYSKTALQIVHELYELKKKNSKFIIGYHRLKKALLNDPSKLIDEGKFSHEDTGVVRKAQQLIESKLIDNLLAVMSKDGLSWQLYSFSNNVAKMINLNKP